MSLKHLPPPPNTQALKSTTFRPPLLDGTLTLPKIYDWHAENTPNHILFRYADDNSQIRDIFWPDGVAAIRRCALLVREVAPKIDMSAPVKPIVAIVSASDTIPYFTTMMGTMYASYVTFPISPRNSPAAIAHLISKTNVAHVLVGREPAMRELVDAAFALLKSDPVYSAYQPKDGSADRTLPGRSDMFIFADLFTDERVKAPAQPFHQPGAQDEFVIYLHSSGSTAFPKPVPWTNYRFNQLAHIPFYGERDLTGVIFSLHVMPMFHGMGILQMPWAASCGLVIAAFEPASPPPLPNPDMLFSEAKACESDILFCVPSFIEQWAGKPEYVKWLATRDGVLFGGGPLNKEAGDHMTSQGVNIFILYGSTEGGIMSPILPFKTGYDWPYFRFPGLVTAHMTPHGEGTFEFVMVENPVCRPSVINTKIDGKDAYATNDLMVEHPEKKGYWRVYGRTDDQIMHNTGEKTNPGPLENILNQDPHVLSSVMFGRGKFQAGVIVDPRPAHKFDPSDKALLAEMRNKIWPTVEQMNAFAPQHSRLFKETIIFASPSKPFTYTAKNTARRQAIINDYDPEIEAMYALLEESTQSNIPPPSSWTLPNTTEFVKRIVGAVLTHGLTGIADDDDLFQHGCDSLQATWIRNSILRALRDDPKVRVDTRGEVTNFVYEHPTLSRLSRFVAALAGGDVNRKSNGADGKNAKVEEMRSLVEKYSVNLEVPAKAVANGTAGAGVDVVFLTGSTGRLGCYILDKLVSSPEVARVYAFNRGRKEGPPLKDRQAAALAAQGLNASILDSKVVLVEGSLSVAGFNIDPSLFNEMHHSVTRVIHNAWQVDFNITLPSFEANIRGLRHLVDFALSSPRNDLPKFTYISSIGVFQTPKLSSEVQNEVHIDPEVAIGNGYTESKWVSEQILLGVSKTTPLRPVVVRVGQLCGGPTGAWNPNEWAPAIVQSAPALRCLPGGSRNVDWIPPHHTASAVVDLSQIVPSSDAQIVHLVHPRPVPWDILANALAKELTEVKVVSYAEWLKALDDHAASTSTNAKVDDIRALRLLPFFHSLSARSGAEGLQAFGFASLSTERAVAFSKTMADENVLVQLSDTDVKAWIADWRRIGHLA